MRTSTYQIVAILTMLGGQAIALDLTKHQQTCSEIGFKPKTPAFGECVLELHGRDSKTNSSKPAQANSTQTVTPQQNARGDGTPDHATCAKYGFQAGTTEYSQCRMQIDTARKQAEEQERQYQDQLAAQARAKEEAQGEALFLLGMGMLSGAQPNRRSNNFPLIQPPRRNHTYTLPNGRIMTCNTNGSFTNCF